MGLYLARLIIGRIFAFDMWVGGGGYFWEDFILFYLFIYLFIFCGGGAYYRNYTWYYNILTPCLDMLMHLLGQNVHLQLQPVNKLLTFPQFCCG